MAWRLTCWITFKREREKEIGTPSSPASNLSALFAVSQTALSLLSYQVQVLPSFGQLASIGIVRRK